MGKRKCSSNVGEPRFKKPRTSTDSLFERVSQTFQENAINSADSRAMKKYTRDQFEFFGLKSAQRKALSSKFLQEELSPSEIREFVQMLWKQPEREFQYFALDYMDKHIKIFADCPEEFDASVGCVKDLIMTKSWWDTVDRIASHTVGYLVKKHPTVGKPLMEEWINHDNMWLRRTALLHQLSYKQQTDNKMLFKFCSARAHEKEFFIQKAIGWALRNYARISAKNVKSYLLRNKKSLSKLSYREASKHI